MLLICFFFFFQAEDGIRDYYASRGLGFKLQCDRGIAAGEIHRECAAKGRDSGVFAAGTVLPECAGIASGFQFVADIVGISGHQHIHISSGNGQNAA